MSRIRCALTQAKKSAIEPYAQACKKTEAGIRVTTQQRRTLNRLGCLISQISNALAYRGPTRIIDYQTVLQGHLLSSVW